MKVYVCYEANYNIVANDCGAADEIHLYSNWDGVRKWLKEAIDRGIENGFVVEEESSKELDELLNTPADIRLSMYYKRQDNFNEYYDITVELKELCV